MAMSLDETEQRIQQERVRIAQSFQEVTFQTKFSRSFFEKAIKELEDLREKLAERKISIRYCRDMLIRIDAGSYKELNDLAVRKGKLFAEVVRLYDIAKDASKNAKISYVKEFNDMLVKMLGKTLEKTSQKDVEEEDSAITIIKKASNLVRALKFENENPPIELILEIIKELGIFFLEIPVLIESMEKEDREAMKAVLDYYKMQFDEYRRMKLGRA